MIENEEATPTHHVPQVRVVTAPSCGAAVPTQPAAATAAEAGGRRGWASVGAVALGAFVIVLGLTVLVSNAVVAAGISGGMVVGLPA